MRAVSVSDSTPTVGQQFRVHARVANVGTAPSPSTRLWVYKRPAGGAWNFVGGSDSVGPISPNRYRSFSRLVTAPATAGTYEYSACVERVEGEPSASNCFRPYVTVTVWNLDSGVVITSNGGGDRATIALPENQREVTTVTASGGTPPYEFQWSSGAEAPDGLKFTMNTTTGALAFVTAPDYENPTDDNGDNDYVVDVYVVDSSLPRVVGDSQIITVTVTDVRRR